MRKNTDPNLTATFDVTCDRTTACFDLTRSDAATTGCFETVLPEADLASAMRQATVAAFHHLAEFHTLGL